MLPDGTPRESLQPDIAVDLAAPKGGPGDPILYQALKLLETASCRTRFSARAVEALDVHDHALVRAFADQLALVLRAHLEIDRAPVHAQHLGRRAHAHSHGRGGDVRHVEVRAQALVLLGQRLTRPRRARRPR